MKTTILTIAILSSLVFGSNQSTFAANSNKEEVTTIAETTAINKIEVHGNVEVYVSNGTTDQVKVYNNYYANNALVQDVDGVLRISSYNADKLVVWVTVSDLRSLVAYDNAEIKSFGKLSMIDLDLKLYNTASAKLDLDVYQAKITLNDKAKSDITGYADKTEMNYDQSSYLNTTGFASLSLVKKVNANYVNNEELVSL